MDEKYFAKKIEAKWQRIWQEKGTFKAERDDERPKFYQLEMLPYPSGNLHMGHVRNYSVGDAVAWYKRLKGFNVLHPIGWDSFGQPAEDAAIKRGVNPRQWTEDNIITMRGQLERLGLSYDWTRQMYAHRPEYYKFDQWFFLKMLENGMAYKKTTQVNWCETDQATLSNEQASGGLCWRCGNPVIKKDLEQWFFATTKYAGQLIDDMAEIEGGWPENVLKRQRDWIGRSEGAFVDFKVGNETVRVFTTRIDTIYGVNAVVVAAEHDVVNANLSRFSDEVKKKIAEMRTENLKPKDHDVEIEKDGIDTGLRAINPFSNEEVPVWVGNYVLTDYGTGAVMSVPGHDERDFEFTKKFNLPKAKKDIVVAPPSPGADNFAKKIESYSNNSSINQLENIQAIAAEANILAVNQQGMNINQVFTDYGVMINSGNWNGTKTADAKLKMSAFAQENEFGEAATTFRLRDWGVSRQRFWGAPIPIIYCDDCGVVPEKYENLPVELPETAPFTGTGESPLAKVAEFYETDCPMCGKAAKRETDTMDTFVDSSWYYFRYLDPSNTELPFVADDAKYWTPVDQYIGGDDHAVMHLIYTRFWSKMMRDIGLIDFNEPVKNLLTQGMVVGETFFDEESGKRIYFKPDVVTIERGEKGKIVSAKVDGKDLNYAIERMSKSKGNGVDPDEMVDIYGADSARLFVLFAAPVENELVWNESGIEGAVRFLQRVWRFVYKWEKHFDHAVDGDVSPDAKILRQKTHQSIKKIDDALDSLQFNTPVAALMELCNALYDYKIEPLEASDGDVNVVKDAVKALILMLTPFAPHIAEELYSIIARNDDGIVGNARFPEFIAEYAKASEIEIPVQVNGKLRSKVLASPDATNAELESLAKSDEKIVELIEGKEIVKVVVVPKRLVNIVIKP